VRILYATPSLAHQHDFLLIENVLVDLLNRYSGRVRLLTVGTLPLSESLVTVSRWIDNEQSTDYAGFLEILSGVDINLVPLASNAFNATKSNIKFLDAAAVEVPSVCSPVGDYRRLPDGECCFLASTEKEWLEKIVQLIEDDALRERMGKKAAAWAVKVYGMHAVDEELAVFLREKI
jgi:glycosyltransferase involved in cell wall biosynthesis